MTDSSAHKWASLSAADTPDLFGFLACKAILQHGVPIGYGDQVRAVALCRGTQWRCAQCAGATLGDHGRTGQLAGWQLPGLLLLHQWRGSARHTGSWLYRPHTQLWGQRPSLVWLNDSVRDTCTQLGHKLFASCWQPQHNLKQPCVQGESNNIAACLLVQGPTV